MNRNATRARTGLTGAVMSLSPGTASSGGLPPFPGTGSLLSGIAACPSAVWVVGLVGQKPLAARWDGTSWTVIPDPSESSLASAALVGARLRSVACVPAPASTPRPDGGTVIAVGGAYDRLERVDVGLIRHWTGSAWTSWDAPDLLRGLVLTAVAPAGPSGCAWAVGHATPHGPRAFRWDGTSWEPSDIPDIPRGRLVAVTAVAPDDVWAVGSADRAGLVLHFDGRAWTRVPSPAKGPLTGVSAVSPDDVWAVGGQGVLHWDGRRWSRVKTPLTSANTVSARASDNVWIAGGDGGPARFDGRRWTVLPSRGSTVWMASAFAPDHTLWLAGTRTDEGASDASDPTAVTAQPNDV
ncbi:WD40/YVTN/BNR-like repeat-containing protein [Actinomadura oligospora]|uniref:WD40/YVTN/BNR-like repeat-containing protein n=1 Tax=Actinomadura oligospora TaxID=111804 RepID=UPI00047E2E6F|nr:hypothetical protein [Actinomadura oligospora]